MPKFVSLASVRRLSAAERRLAAEALAELVRARLAILVLPFARSVRFGAIPLGAARHADPALVISRMVERVSGAVPWRSVCFDRGIAAQRMLRRRGIDARLHYGGTLGADRLSAHVWVTADGEPLTGAAEAESFGELARYP